MIKQNPRRYHWTLLKTCALWLLVMGILYLTLGASKSSLFYEIDDAVVRLLGVPAILLSIGLFFRRRWAFVGSVWWWALAILESMLTYNPRVSSNYFKISLTEDIIATLVFVGIFYIVPLILLARLLVIFIKKETEPVNPKHS